MGEKEIKDGNLWIAEFIGWTFDVKDGQVKCYFNGKLRWQDTERFMVQLFNSESGFAYHLKWEQLMPVVEKIEVLQSPLFQKVWVSINGNECSIWTYFDVSEALRTQHQDGKFKIKRSSKSKITATWLAVTDFLTWYNQQQK